MRVIHDRSFPKRGCLLLCLALLLIIWSSNISSIKAEQEELFFTILHTNDEHSALLPSPLVDYDPVQENPSMGGFARLAGAVTEIRAAKAAEGEPVLLLSGGDFLGGSPFSWLALQGRAPELSLMLEMGYDVVTIGNHEYDYGPDLLATYLQAAGYPRAAANTALLATNTLPPAGHPLLDVGIKKIHVQTLDNGLTLGFLGLMGKDAIQVAPYSEPVEFTDQHTAARAAVEELKEAGADIIIAITHSGVEEDREMARDLPEIDIIVGGHCHTALNKPILEGSTIILQTGAYLEHLGILEVAYDPGTGNLRVRNGQTPHLLPLDHKVHEDEAMSALVDAYTQELNALIVNMTEDRFRKIDATVAYADIALTNRPPLAESLFGNFIADAMRLTAQATLGEDVDFAFQANGVIRGAMVPGSTTQSLGRVSFMDLVTQVGLGAGPDGKPGYPMVSVYFTGEEVRRVLEISALLSDIMGDAYFLQMSGLRMTYDPDRAILFWVPIKNLPVPTSRAVLSAERYTGEGLQGEEGYLPLKRGDEGLYHLVTDYYIASFLPMVGDMLPSLGLVPKDKDGHEVDIKERIIYRNGEELKVWQAVVEYAAGQDRGPNGEPLISDYYSAPPSRITYKRTIPLLLWPALGAAFALILFIVFLRRRKQRRRNQEIKKF